MKIDIEYLREEEACASGVKWFVACFPKGETTLAEVLKAFTPNESGYYGWIINHLFNREQAIWLACVAARRALRFVPKGELRPLACIETVEAFVKGEKTLSDVRVAQEACWAYRRESWAAAAAAAAADAAADAAAAAAYAYADAADAADAAAYAAARRKEWAEIMALVALEVVKASFKKLGKVPAGTLK